MLVLQAKGDDMKKLYLIIFVLMLTVTIPVQAADNMKAFPPPGKGMVRHVLKLAKQKDESAFRVELIIGKTVRIDKKNRYFFDGNIEIETIKGWGFTRYVVSELGAMAGTLIAVEPDAPKVERFITMGGAPYLIRYNSRLPVVVYVPEGVEVRYRLWRAGDDIKTIEEG
jgi:ecotin